MNDKRFKIALSIILAIILTIVVVLIIMLVSALRTPSQISPTAKAHFITTTQTSESEFKHEKCSFTDEKDTDVYSNS